MIGLIFVSILFQTVLLLVLSKNELYSMIEKDAGLHLVYAYLSLNIFVIALTVLFYVLLYNRLFKCMGSFDIDDALRSHSSGLSGEEKLIGEDNELQRLRILSGDQ